MAGPRTRRNADEALTDNSGTPKPTSAVSHASTPAPALILAPASVPGPPRRYTDKDLQRITKLALESFVKGPEHSQL